MSGKIQSITELNETHLDSLVLTMGEPEYRAKQLRHWVYKNMAFSFGEMTNLPLTFRHELKKLASLHSLKELHRSAGRDGTIKILFTLADGMTLESVLMTYSHRDRPPRHTVCVSTQAGCAIGCPFCATGQQGFQRNLTCGEIIDQVLYFARYLKDQNGSSETAATLSNIVFMGMGEPLANYDTLWQAIETLNSPNSFGMGARNITISTAGLVPQIKRMSHERLQVGLAISLHAADNILRDRLVPVNRKYPLEELIPACREYSRMTGRRVSFEYILFKGINDSVTRASALAQLLQDLNCHVNLILANPTPDRHFQPPQAPVVLAFESTLKNSHINTTLRQSRGQDIDASCGQLHSRFLNNTTGVKKTNVKE